MFIVIDADIRCETDLIHAIRSDTAIHADGRRYLHTTKQKIGKANNLLVYSFWFYNKFSALFRGHKRKLELIENHLYVYVPRHGHRERRAG